ncbi:MAG: Hsp20/alpha crystallin family protein [Trueperaceae bacterium]
MAVARTLTTRPRQTSRYSLGTPTSFGNLFQEVEQLLQQPLGMLDAGRLDGTQFYPVDLYETAENVVLEMAVPGVRADQLDVSLEGRQLTIRGSVAEVPEDDQRRYWLQGIPRGEFTRTVTVPSGVDVDNIQARVDQGLLTLTMPKVAEAKSRKIAITAG